MGNQFPMFKGTVISRINQKMGLLIPYCLQLFLNQFQKIYSISMQYLGNIWILYNILLKFLLEPYASFYIENLHTHIPIYIFFLPQNDCGYNFESVLTCFTWACVYFCECMYILQEMLFRIFDNLFRESDFALSIKNESIWGLRLLLYKNLFLLFSSLNFQLNWI